MNDEVVQKSHAEFISASIYKEIPKQVRNDSILDYFIVGLFWISQKRAFAQSNGLDTTCRHYLSQNNT